MLAPIAEARNRQHTTHYPTLFTRMRARGMLGMRVEPGSMLPRTVRQVAAIVPAFRQRCRRRGNTALIKPVLPSAAAMGTQRGTWKARRWRVSDSRWNSAPCTSRPIARDTA
jgi:hypothetical protein